MRLIRIIPPAISGLALGLASLGVLLEGQLSQSLPWLAFAVKVTCGVLAGVGLALLTLRAILDFENLKNEFGTNVIPWSVLPTYFMCWMVLSTYLKPIFGSAALYIWALALCLQLILVVYFIYRFIFKFSIQQVYSSWFVVAVGFVVGTTTSSAFEMYSVGKVLLFLGIIGYALTVLLVAYRLIKHPITDAPAKPTMAISMAPANLIIVGCVTLANANILSINIVYFWPIVLLSLAGIIFVLVSSMPLLFGDFYPSLAAFTFPAAISATALTQISKSLIPCLALIAFVMQVAATLVVGWVLIRYIQFLGQKVKL